MTGARATRGGTLANMMLVLDSPQASSCPSPLYSAEGEQGAVGTGHAPSQSVGLVWCSYAAASGCWRTRAVEEEVGDPRNTKGDIYFWSGREYCTSIRRSALW